MKEKTKIYQASTSELYGLVQETPQSEKPLFIQEVHMELLNYMPTGLLLTIESPIIFSLVMGFYLIMNRPEEEKHLLLEK